MANQFRSNRPNKPDDFTRAPFHEYRGYTPSLGIDLRQAAGIPVFFIVVTWFMFTPLGILLTALKVIGVKQKEEAARWMRQYGDNGNMYDAPQSPRPAARKAPKAKKGSGNALPNLLLIGGILLIIIGFNQISSWVYFLLTAGWNLGDFWRACSQLGWFASGAAMLLASRSLKKRARLWKKLKAIVGRKDNMYISDIAAALPASYKDAVKGLEGAIDHGEFGASAYLDMRSKSLVVRGEAPEPAEALEPPKEPEKPQEVNQYDAVLLELRQINDAIPGEEMSAKIDRLEAVTTRIFELAEKDPDKLPQLRRFMDYYLPTALKLLKSYAEFDRQGVEGAILSDSKKKIEETMDTLVVGFEQQLDKLFQDEALDLSADISVLKNMMAQDGLSGEDSPFAKN